MTTTAFACYIDEIADLAGDDYTIVVEDSAGKQVSLSVTASLIAEFLAAGLRLPDAIDDAEFTAIWEAVQAGDLGPEFSVVGIV